MQRCEICIRICRIPLLCWYAQNAWKPPENLQRQSGRFQRCSKHLRYLSPRISFPKHNLFSFENWGIFHEELSSFNPLLVWVQITYNILHIFQMSDSSHRIWLQEPIFSSQAWKIGVSVSEIEVFVPQAWELAGIWYLRRQCRSLVLAIQFKQEQLQCQVKQEKDKC